MQEGTGSATISAYVEIVFDNSDNRFPVSDCILYILLLDWLTYVLMIRLETTRWFCEEALD